MSRSEAAPKDLGKWISERVHLLRQLADELDRIDQHDRADKASWALNLLEEAAQMEIHARRMTHLLTTYLLREQLASPTVVARRSQITITAAQNRAGSALAQEVWREVWPGKS